MPAKILVVDDSAMVRRQLAQALEPAFVVLEAENGADALVRLEEAGDVAMIITDVNMPVMGGLDFLARLSSQRGASMPPVMLLTTEGQKSLIDRARALGAKGWVVKPFKPELVVAAVRKLTADSAAA